MNNKFKLVVLISGNGSNLQAIIDGIRNGLIDATIEAVISNRPDAVGLTRARKANIMPLVHLAEQFDSSASYDQALGNVIEAFEPDLIILAGFMRILSPELVDRFAGKMINIHPSLLPKYRGLHTHKRALEAGDQEHGCTVHLVTSELDSGPILAQAKLNILANETEEDLKARVLQLEHQLLPQVIQDFTTGKLPIKQ